MIHITAPGKLLIAGEYSVLRGGSALVTAVDRRISLTLAEGPPEPLSPEVARTLALVERWLGPLEGAVRVDKRALEHEDRKLGLGSSAASAVAAAALALAAHGVALTDPPAQSRLLYWALQGHFAVAPKGSGADVWASALGGTVLLRTHGDARAGEPFGWPARVRTSVIWTGQPVRTSGLVAAVEALEAREPLLYTRRMAAIGEAAEDLIDAARRAALDDLLEATRAHAEALRLLGDAASVPIVEARLTKILALATAHGGAAKPSGAGGGDIAIAFFAEDDARQRFEQACRDASLVPLELSLGAPGVRLEPPAAP